MRQLAALSRAAFGAADSDATFACFGIEPAEPVLRRRFAEVELIRFDEALRCADPIDVLA